MSGISRRSLLGYSGTAAAGAVLSGAAAAEAAEAGTEGTAAEGARSAAAATAPAFPPGTQFKGRTSLPGYEGELLLTFSVAITDASPGHDVPPIEIANALAQLAQQHGWQPFTFYGTPAPAPLTS
ncbi:hypothetical protein [Streptomyces sp. NPDC097619]|uniref:hypothetical protein n=1 Tax=Streptomyces sp. NPDC097619 TaxID=3157228 RepID=UPI00331F3370